MTKEERKAYGKAWREANKGKLSAEKRAWYEKNKEAHKARSNAYYATNKKAMSKQRQAYRDANKERQKVQGAAWYSKNKEKAAKYALASTRKNRASNPFFVLSETLRARAKSAFRAKGVKKDTKTEVLLGGTLIDVKAHIQAKFSPGMTWDNRGRKGWSIDHIIPLASAENKEDLEMLCHYKNLQPLWAKDNLEKSSKMPPLEVAVAVMLEIIGAKAQTEINP